VDDLERCSQVTAAPLTPFQQWIADTARAVGAEVPAEIDPLGFAFEAEGRLARVLPHTDEALAVIEVAATSLKDVPDDELAWLALQLLRLNHEARFEHGWSIVIDEGDGVRVTTTVTLSATDGTTLAELLYDGIDRAALLSTVVSGLISAAASDVETDAPAGAGAIRA
jgi:hypothetical protein